MQTVVETPAFQKAAEKAGVTKDEVETAITQLARNPEAGDLIKGSGGCRKVRMAGKGKGKSGGYRLITYYGGPQSPLFLLTIYSKSDKVNLSKEQVETMRVFIKTSIKGHGKKRCD